MECSVHPNGDLRVREWYSAKEYGELVEMIHNKIRFYQNHRSEHSDKWIRRELSEEIADEVMKLMESKK